MLSMPSAEETSILRGGDMLISKDGFISNIFSSFVGLVLLLIFNGVFLLGCSRSAGSHTSTDESGLSGDNSSQSPVQPAYYLATLGTSDIDPQRETRVIVAGYGSSASTLFQEAAVSEAHRYQEIYPHAQVFLILVAELPDLLQRAQLKRWGLNHIKSEYRPLSAHQLFLEMRGLKKIAALHIYSHATETRAVLSHSEDFGLNDTEFIELKNQFTIDAFGLIHGCNAGKYFAPMLAQTLGIPVAGALTSTNFEALHSNGNFYFNDNIFKPEGDWSAFNSKSYISKRPCGSGGCLRMRPDNRSYDGYWGRYESGLPFYKFYCPPGIEAARCERAMATALIGYIDDMPMSKTQTLTQFRNAVQNFMCPINKAGDLRKSCKAALLASESTTADTYSPFEGKSLDCDMYECHEVEDGIATKSFVREYKTYLRGYRSLRKDL
jgi:hypothetical protein